MTRPGRVPDLRISENGRPTAHEAQFTRHFVGLQLCKESATIYGALIRTWGRGLRAVTDVIASSRCRDGRIPGMLSEPLDGADRGRPSYRRPAAELAELAAEAVAPLIRGLAAEATSLRAVGLLDFGNWIVDPLGGTSFVPRCDTALLAKMTGLTVVDDLPARDLAHGGRGGPCEAAGAWLLLSDRGTMPGRMIRALIDVNQTTRLFLLPPRQPVQLPPQLICYELGPGLSLLDGIMTALSRSPATFDTRENLAVQARRNPELMRQWQQSLPSRPTDWTPHGVDAEPLLQCLTPWTEPLSTHLADVLCSAIHLIAERVASCVKHHLPRSLPVGQLILGGPLSQHAFLLRQLKQQISEVEVSSIDDQVASTDSWRSVAAALLGMLHVDQVPSNSPALTGAQAPRILGRLTPGAPGNWHRVLADMASTLPDKMTLRSAV